MYWLVVLAFMHTASVPPVIVAPSPFKSRDACMAQASKMNKLDPLAPPRDPEIVFVCLSLVYPS